MTARRTARPNDGPFRRMVAIAVLATAVSLAGVAALFLPERSGLGDLIDSPSAPERRLGLLLVVLVLPAVLVAAAALSRILRWLPGPRVVRGGLTAVLWAGTAVVAAAWLPVAVVASVASGLAGRDARADAELSALPGRVAAVTGVISVGDALLAGTDLASGHNLYVTADLDPALTREERLLALDRISAVLAERQSNDLRMLAEVRSGPVAVGVSGDPGANRYRLSLAEDVVAATGADHAVVTWYEPGDDLVYDDRPGICVVVHSFDRPLDQVAAVAERAVRARASDGSLTVQRHPSGARPPASYDSTSAPAAGDQVRVELRPAG